MSDSSFRSRRRPSRHEDHRAIRRERLDPNCIVADIEADRRVEADEDYAERDTYFFDKYGPDEDDAWWQEGEEDLNELAERCCDDGCDADSLIANLDEERHRPLSRSLRDEQLIAESRTK